MDYKKFDNKIVLRLKAYDKIIESLETVAKKENIRACHFQGIGACNELKIGLFHKGASDYDWKTYNEDFEITSLMGNITIFEDKPLVHAHITCARENLEIIGGHLGEAICSLTAEIFIDVIDGEIIKKHDDEASINIMQF